MKYMKHIRPEVHPKNKKELEALARKYVKAVEKKDGKFYAILSKRDRNVELINPNEEALFKDILTLKGYTVSYGKS